MEKVDILLVPSFQKSGIVKTLVQAWEDGDWIGTFNLWVVQTSPVPSIVYQIRSPKSSWAPGKLDVTAGGHYQEGETIENGLREVKEELGKDYTFSNLKNLGKKIYLGVDEKGRKKQNVVDVFMIVDNSPLTSYHLEEEEVYAICSCPIAELLKVHAEKDYTFKVKGLDTKGQSIDISVSKDSFPFNFDNYHYKIAVLAYRLVKGEEHLIY